MAQGVAARTVKCFVASWEPRPEFCMPTSMEMVRVSLVVSFRDLAM